MADPSSMRVGGGGNAPPGSESAAAEEKVKAAERSEAATREQEAIDAAVEAIRSAATEAIGKHRDEIAAAADRILDNAEDIYEIREKLLTSLAAIFDQVIDLEAWRHLGTSYHLAGRYRDLENLHLHQYAAIGSFGNDAADTWENSSTVSAADKSLLPQSVLESNSVQQSWWGQIDANNGAGVTHTKGKWSWVSNLEESFKDIFPCPDFAFTRDLSTGATGLVSYNPDGTPMMEYKTFDGWPHGWLTNLEIAMGMIGYYCQVGEDADAFARTAVGSRSGEDIMYQLFDRTAIRDFRGGDVMSGFKTILYANHSYDESWDIYAYRADGPLPGEGSSLTVQDPRKLVSRVFQQANADTCKLFNKGRLQPNSAFTSQFSGPAPMVKDLRPFAMLISGGPFMQTCRNSPSPSKADFEAGLVYITNYGKDKADTGLVNVSKRLKAHAKKFKSLKTIAESGGSSATIDEAGFIDETYGSLSSLTMEDGVSKKFMYLARFLEKVAGVLDSTLTSIYGDHVIINQKHREIIREICEAYARETDFDSDDDVDWPFTPDDDWDDHLGPEVAEALAGDVIGDLNESFVGTGQTSVMFKEQCFLLSFVSDFAMYKKEVLDTFVEVPDNPFALSSRKSRKTLPYYETNYTERLADSNSTILMDGGSYGFLNLLTQNPKLSRFYNIKNHELSNLQPKIRLWKVIFDEQGNEKEIPISFDSNFTAREFNMFKNSAARGAGVGLKSFNFVYDGSNPFSVKKSIKANLKIFGNTMSELLRDRPGSYTDANGEVQSTTYKYTDLAMKTWNLPEDVNFSQQATEEEDIDAIDPVLESLDFDMLTENVNKAELNFRLKAQIGFSAGLNTMSSLPYDLREALQESHVTLNLTPTVHNFEIDEFGRVVFNINYLAYVEQFFDQTMFNVFTSKEITLSRIVRELALKYYTGPAGCSAEQVNQKKDDFSKIVKTEQEQAISSLISDLMVNQLVYYVNMPYDEVRDFLSDGPHGSYEKIMGGEKLKVRNDQQHDEYMKDRVNSALSEAFAGSESVTDENKGQIQAALLGNDPRETDLAFFYLSDLVDMVLRKIEKGIDEVIPEMDKIRTYNQHSKVVQPEDAASRKKDLLNAKVNLKKLRIMMGPMELTHPKAKDGAASHFVNLGDVPISLKYFVEWLTNKMLKKDEVIYPLTRFINDLVNNLLNTFLNADNCFGYSIRQKTRLNQATITAWGENEDLDPITQQIKSLHAANSWKKNDPFAASITEVKQRLRGSVSDFAMPVLNPSGPGGARTSIPFSNEYNFMVFFAGRTMPEELMKGVKSEDEPRGIFHYMIGRDKGLIKNIKLTKTQTKGLAEVRFEQEGYEGLEQLRVVYDAQVDMFASVNTFPGTYIYIDPKGFTPEGSGVDEFGLTDLGIGGYYMIVRSEHEFAEGKANTILHTKWVNQIDRDEDDRQNQLRSQTTGTGGKISRRCAIQLRPPPEATAPDPPGFFDLFF